MSKSSLLDARILGLRELEIKGTRADVQQLSTRLLRFRLVLDLDQGGYQNINLDGEGLAAHSGNFDSDATEQDMGSVGVLKADVQLSQRITPLFSPSRVSDPSGG